MYSLTQGASESDVLDTLNRSWSYLAHIVADAGDVSESGHHPLPVIAGNAGQRGALERLALARQDARRSIRAASNATRQAVYKRACKAMLRATVVKGAPTLGTTGWTEDEDGRWGYLAVPTRAKWGANPQEEPLDAPVVIEDTAKTQPYVYTLIYGRGWSIVRAWPRMTVRYSGHRLGRRGVQTEGIIIARNETGAGIFPLRIRWNAPPAVQRQEEAPVEAPSESPEEPPSGE